jgi:hypothetical protein
MKFVDDMKILGSLKVVLTDENGVVKEEREIPNLVVSSGKTFIASRMVGTTASAMSYMAVGSSSTAPVAGDVTLGAELGRVALTSGTSSGAVATYVASFGTGVGTGAIVEAGILNASTAGTMLCRTTFAVVNKGANDTMTITWTVTVN